MSGAPQELEESKKVLDLVGYKTPLEIVKTAKSDCASFSATLHELIYLSILSNKAQSSHGKQSVLQHTVKKLETQSRMLDTDVSAIMNQVIVNQAMSALLHS